MKLTLPQQDVYFEQLLYPNEPIYNIGAKIVITGKLSVSLLQSAYSTLIDQHDTYRCVLDHSKEQVEMNIVESHNSSLEIVDYSDEKNAHELADAFMQNNFKKPFDLNSKRFLHRFVLIKVNKDLHYLFSVYHHIITDGWGTSLMFQRLVKNYNELLEFGKVTSEYSFTYRDFVENDQAYAQSDDFVKDKLYWKEKFQFLPERVFDKIDRNNQTNKSSRKELVIKRADYNLLTEKAKECKCSTFHLLLGILYLYFSRKHNNKDFAIGLPVLNRGKSIFKKTVGLFMGVSALRIQVDPDQTFEELVQNIRQQLRQDYRHQRFPFGKLVQELGAFQEKDKLFNITMSYEKQNYEDHFENTSTRVIPLSHQSERVALALYVREFDQHEDVKIDFDYNLNYFTEYSINQIVNHFRELLSAVISNPREKLSTYNYLTRIEKERILTNFNQTHFDKPAVDSLLSLFETQVLNRGGKLALEDQNVLYTYHKLDDLSDRVANYLNQNFGTDNKSPVAVLMNRSVEMIVALLGIMKSGRAYIPLDPGFPKKRIKHIIAHSKVDCILSTAELEQSIDHGPKILHYDRIIDLESSKKSCFFERPKETDTAYIIYTSGSTGQPKGVEVSHRALVNFLMSMQQKPGLKPDDFLFSVTTQSFDISILEFFAPLICGASVYIADKDLLDDPIAILEKLKEIGPSIMQATPSFYQLLYNAGWSGDKQLKVLCGGDLLSESLAEKLLDSCEAVWNMYGPTETTIWSSTKQITKASDASNIGKPINNTSFYILDESLNPLPIDSPGAIYIGGDGLAKGYYKNEDLTARKFIENPFRKGELMYETGDLGKWHRNGEIEFLGRNDQQVKIRGYRIEIGEIEATINKIEEVKSSVVVAKKHQNQEALLIAFVIFKEGVAGPAVPVLNRLKVELPDFMIPYMVVPTTAFPLTPNQKVDRKKLEQYDIRAQMTESLTKAPGTELEKILCDYFQEVLEFDTSVNATENFFKLGGHSLNAVKLINLINKNLHYQLSLKTIFDFPTAESLAMYLEKEGLKRILNIEEVAEQADYPINDAQYSIWLAAQESGKSIAYNMSAAFEIKGRIYQALLEKAFVKIISKYEVLRTNFIEVEGTPRQKISRPDEVSFKVDKIDVKSGGLNKVIQNYVNKEFDLENELLLKLGLFEDQKGASYLVFSTHHIIMDGWSLEVLINELVHQYQLLVSGVEANNGRLDFQFKDYTIWQQKLKAEQKSIDQDFWENYLGDYKWEGLPFEKNTASKVGEGMSYHFAWEKSLYSKLEKTADLYKVSLHTLLVSTLNIVLCKMYKRQDICIGTVNAGRMFSGLDSQIGMFVKTLPLRTKVYAEMMFSDFIEQTHKDLLVIDKHQNLPDQTRDNMRLEVLLALQNPTFSYDEISLDEDLTLKSFPVETTYSRMPLLINFSIKDAQLNGVFQYRLDCFEKESIELLVLRYEKLLNMIVENPEILINNLSIDLLLEKDKEVEVNFNF